MVSQVAVLPLLSRIWMLKKYMAPVVSAPTVGTLAALPVGSVPQVIEVMVEAKPSAAELAPGICQMLLPLLSVSWNEVDTPHLTWVAPYGRSARWLRSPAAGARSAQGASELPR
ncbi:MAG TPA: hypothetical protein VIE13_06270 [Terriglobales bacterium]